MQEPRLLCEFHIGVWPDGHVALTHTKLEVSEQPQLGAILRQVIRYLAQYAADEGFALETLPAPTPRTGDTFRHPD